jgi:hypothetical protein
VRLVALDSGKYVVVLVKFSESNIRYCALGTLYKYTIMEGKKSARCGEVTITSTWHIKFLSDLWNYKEEISDNYRMEFHTQKGQNFGDTIEERPFRRTTSKSRFKRFVVFWKFAYLLTIRFN